MSVRRVVESPRVTKPYSDEQWRAVDAFGRRIEQQLDGRRRAPHDRRRADVRRDRRSRCARVEHGREPGRRKRRFATDLIQRLRARFAPGGLLHFGQGKWYPGEQLPRWAFSLYWRRDGKALWRDGRADRRGERRLRRHRQSRRARSSRASRVRLELDPVAAVAGVRGSVALHRRRNASCPRTSIRPPIASTIRWRARGSHASSSAAWASPSASCCPCSAGTPRRRRRSAGAPSCGRRARASCSSCRAIRRSGFACRCRRCTHLPPSQYPHVMPADPFVERERSAGPASAAAAVLAAARSARARRQRPTVAAHGAGHRTRARRSPSSRATGICACSCRRWPSSRTISICSRPSRTRARELDLPIHLEGYEPPRDPRLERDQGDARSRRHRGQHAPGRRAGTRCARSPRASTRTRDYTRLVTEKFMLDGRHTGTGGGNHVVLGGATRGRQPVPAPARPAAQPDHVLAAPSGAVVPLLGHVRRARRARRRASTRRGTTRCTSSSSRSSRRITAGSSRRRPGSSTACSAIC